jgi:hypothetical protein
MVSRSPGAAETLPMTPEPDDLLHRVGSRNRLRGRLSVMGQVTTLLALTSTGVVAGVIAHDAQLKDLQARQSAEALQVPVVPATAPVLKRKPVRTVVVTVPAAKAPAQRTTSTNTRQAPSVASRALPPVRQSTPVRLVPRPAPKAAPRYVPKAAPKPAPKPVATKTSGS